MLVDVNMAEERLLHSASPLRFKEPNQRAAINDINEIGNTFAGAYPHEQAEDSGNEEDVNSIYGPNKEVTSIPTAFQTKFLNDTPSGSPDKPEQVE
jgi:hypothetical protein